MIAFLTQIFPLVLSIWAEYARKKALADAKQEKFVLDQAKFRELVQAVLIASQQDAANQSQGAGSGWDAADGAKRFNVCGVDCKPGDSKCNGYCQGKAASPALKNGT